MSPLLQISGFHELMHIYTGYGQNSARAQTMVGLHKGS